MRFVTRKLISARRPHTTLTLEPINVRSVPIGIPNQCYQNASMVEELEPNAMMVSGWLVGQFDPIAKITPIVAHWWNIADGEHVDATPEIGSDYEYVLDLNVMRYAYKHDDMLDTHVPSSLAYTGNGFLLAIGGTTEELEFIPVDHLTDGALFEHCHL